MRLVVITVLLISCSLATAQVREPCSLTSSTVSDAKLTLSIPDGRTSFREGEIIPLVLSFTSTADKRYRAVVRNYDRSGRLNLDTYCLEPEARDPLADYFSTGLFMGGGLGGEAQLSEQPFTATADLNEWRQPGPGHYRLYAVSPRVSGEPGSLDSLRHGGVSVVLRSNTIEFDVIKQDAESRAKQLQEATAAYENAANESCQNRHECTAAQAARRLRFLNTKESTETLARLFSNLNEQPGGWDLMFGLFGSSYQAEAIAAMQREINSPDHPITQDFLVVFTKLQLLQIAGEVPGKPMDNPAASKKLFERMENMRAHEPEVRKAALNSTVAALPHKTGRAHALTLVTLATERSDLLDKETVTQMRRQLFSEWNSLPEKTREELIQNNWPPLDGTEALPILREIVSQPRSHFGNGSVVTNRDRALERILELNPTEGRSLILRDLSDPEAQPSLSLLKSLSPAQLHPFVQRAVQRIVASRQVPPSVSPVPIQRVEARPWDYSVVEEFADKSALAPLAATFEPTNDHLPPGFCPAYSVQLLRYFLRVDPQFGEKAIQEVLSARKGTQCYPRLFEDLGKSLPIVERFAIIDLDDADLEISASAARALGGWGTPKAEPALWARLTRFHQEWPNGVGELPLTDKDASARVQALDHLESTLVQSIVTGRNWICGPEKLTRLRAIASRQRRQDLSHWIEEWENSDPASRLLSPYWGSEEIGLIFTMLQYHDLDEEQLRTKLSQMPRGSTFYFVTHKAEEMSAPVSMEKQQAVFQGLRKYAAQFGVTIELATVRCYSTGIPRCRWEGVPDAETPAAQK